MFSKLTTPSPLPPRGPAGSHMKKRSLLIVAALAVTLAFASALAAPAGAVQPIEGSWFFEGGQVLVEPIGPNAFKGTVIRPTSFSECTHPVGQRMWEIAGSGAIYAGTHVYFQSPTDCSPNPGGLSVWGAREDSARFLLDFCSAPPGKGAPGTSNPETRCHTLDRAKAPPNRTQSCAAGGRVCVNGPQDLRTIGCLRRIQIPHRFQIKLTTRGGSRALRRARVTLVSFKLDGAAAGRDRRRPFETVLRGEALAPGAHALKATVTLLAAARNGGSGQRLRRTITYRFNACERG